MALDIELVDIGTIRSCETLKHYFYWDTYLEAESKIQSCNLPFFLIVNSLHVALEIALGFLLPYFIPSKSSVW
ncbi:hypothetical protein Pelo_13785 [Pelomyxa schiedti]|nr:hypothetical protein Pelo_13785 [Pelomyxa schiedti]